MLNVHEYFQKKKEIQSALLLFLDKDDNDEENYENILKLLNDQKISEDKHEVKLIFALITQISNQHYRMQNFFQKIEKLIIFFEREIKEKFDNFEVFDIFKSNKRILLFLLEKKLMNIDESIFDEMTKYEYYKSGYLPYFFTEVKSIFFDKKSDILKKEIFSYQTPYDFNKIFNDFSSELPENFEEKRKIGENDSFLFQLIRKDMIDEFISYVNKNEYPLKSTVKPSIYETNLLLLDKNPTLIEYAAFFGSIQVFKYLYLNGVDLTSSLWIYAIHGCSPEIIDILKRKNVEPDDDSIKNDEKNIIYDEYEYDYDYENEDISFNKIYKEAIKCHHNDVVNYIQSNYIIEKIENYDIENKFLNNVVAFSLKYYNFQSLPKEINCPFTFYYFCRFGYFNLVDFYMKTRNIDINATILASESNNVDIIQLLLSHPQIRISHNSFSNCQTLREITIPPSIPSIGQYAFNKCTSLQKVIIPESVITIEIGAFCDCHSLTQITIPSSVKEIESHAFSKCSSLTQISIPSSVSEIGEFAFEMCESLQNVTFSEPSLISVFKENTFAFCTSLQKIKLPKSVKLIKGNAFLQCTSLKKISIPSLVKKIGAAAFYQCSSLENVSFDVPSSLILIGSSAFGSCTSLTNISIPPSVISLSQDIFDNCTSLKEVKVSRNLYDLVCFDSDINVKFLNLWEH